MNAQTAHDAPGDELIDWLLDTDPALRWRVERDWLRAPASVWQATRARVAREGWGAQLLARQDDDGRWAGGAHFPGRGELGIVVVGEADAQPWVATSWSLTQLREWGVSREAMGDTAGLLEANCAWEYDNLPFWQGEVDVCINAMTLANGAWLGRDMSHLATWFAEHQLADGGWNCEWEFGKTTSSFHSTLNALLGILDWQQRIGDTTLDDVRHRAHEYLLERHLLRRRSTGQTVAPFVHEFVDPPRYRYSALRALDYFRRAAEHDGTEPDARLADALRVVVEKRQTDGTWLQDGPLDGIVWFRTEPDHGEPSRALTLQGLLVTRWLAQLTS